MVRENKQERAFDFEINTLHSFPDKRLAIEVNVKLWHCWYTLHLMLGVTVGPTDEELQRNN